MEPGAFCLRHLKTPYRARSVRILKLSSAEDAHPQAVDPRIIRIHGPFCIIFDIINFRDVTFRRDVASD